MNNVTTITAALATLTLVAGGCIVEDGTDAPANTGGSAAEAGSGGSGGSTSNTGGMDVGGSGGGGGAPAADNGWVFTMSNEAAGNELIVFERADDGALTEMTSLPTGGDGSGDGLGSQGALALSPDGEYLYVVNAGSNQLSAFQIYEDHLALVDLVDSGGERPVSVAAGEDNVYVVNAGGDGVVQSFAMEDGMLVAGGSQGLSGPGAGPGQIGLSPDGTALIVTEKATDSLLTYWVAPNGSMSAPTVTASEGMTPFGFDFTDDGLLVVSEAFGGNDGESAVSSYTLGSVEPEVVSSSIPSGQTAACWLVIAGTFAYTTNTASNTVSGYTIDAEGNVNLFDDNGITADLGDEQSPLDAALSQDDAYLYVLNGRSDRLVGFMVDADGSLVEMEDSHDVPAPSVGLVAR